MNSTFDDICRAMSEPAFYSHPAALVERRETHISVVFLAGDWAYKLKKHKDLGFLDFRDPARRLYFCQQEVTLNQRLSVDVYHEVLGIHDGKDGLCFGPVPGALEYAVKMRRLPDEASLEALLRSGRVAQDDISRLGETLAAFHAKSQRGGDIDAYGDIEHIRFNMEENFTQIQPFARDLLDLEKWEFFCQVCRSFAFNHADLFMHRVREGRISDGHGDLRAEHVYFHHGVQVIDCIEFNERFRYGDCALDLAFLIMDLDRLGQADAARRLLRAYATASGDMEVYALVDFYAAYRAAVRLKVACLSLEHASDRAALTEEIHAYLDLACRYAISFGRPVLWVFCGLPASGKSTLARRVASAMFMPLFASDTVRKEDPDFPQAGVEAFNAGAYRPVLRDRVYARLFNLAQDEIKKGRSVVLDATFSKAKWRESALLLADDLKAGIVFVECACQHQTIKQRLARRKSQEGESDARLMHFNDLIAGYEPFGEAMTGVRISIDTDQTVEECVQEILAQGHAIRHAQAFV